jgi:hypothetical protein
MKYGHQENSDWSGLQGGCYALYRGAKVLNDTNEIHLIKYDERKQSIKIYIINPKQEVVLWKEFSSTIPVSIEYNINY